MSNFTAPAAPAQINKVNSDQRDVWSMTTSEVRAEMMTACDPSRRAQLHHYMHLMTFDRREGGYI